MKWISTQCRATASLRGGLSDRIAIVRLADCVLLVVGVTMDNTMDNIRESVDSLCRDGADAQYMQYLRKSRITSPQIC